MQETKEKVEFYVNQDVFDYTFKFGTVVSINQQMVKNILLLILETLKIRFIMI